MKWLCLEVLVLYLSLNSIILFLNLNEQFSFLNQTKHHSKWGRWGGISVAIASPKPPLLLGPV